METTYIGMDLHATTSLMGWLDNNGTWNGQQEVQTTPEALQVAIGRIPGQHKKLVFEQTSQACWVADALRDYVDELYVSDPRYNDRISKAKCKNDSAG